MVELTEAAKMFLREKFADFDKNKDKLLDSEELKQMFDTAPHRFPPSPCRPSETRDYL